MFKHSIYRVQGKLTAEHIICIIVLIVFGFLAVMTYIHRPPDNQIDYSKLCLTVTSISYSDEHPILTLKALPNDLTIKLKNASDTKFIIVGNKYTFNKCSNTDNIYKLDTRDTDKYVKYAGNLADTANDLGEDSLEGTVVYKYVDHSLFETECCVVYVITVDGNKYNCVESVPESDYNNISIGHTYQVIESESIEYRLVPDKEILS